MTNDERITALLDEWQQLWRDAGNLYFPLAWMNLRNGLPEEEIQELKQEWTGLCPLNLPLTPASLETPPNNDERTFTIWCDVYILRDPLLENVRARFQELCLESGSMLPFDLKQTLIGYVAGSNKSPVQIWIAWLFHYRQVFAAVIESGHWRYHRELKIHDPIFDSVCLLEHLANSRNETAKHIEQPEAPTPEYRSIASEVEGQMDSTQLSVLPADKPVLSPAIRNAWLSYQLAETIAEQEKIEDGKAFNVLSEFTESEWEQIKDLPPELEGYKLPRSFGTWSKYVRIARKALGLNKNNMRAGRESGKSVVRADQT